MSDTTADKLSTRTKFIYGLGDWGASAATTARNLYWFFFLVSIVGLEANLTGRIFLVGRIWDSINDPLIGMLSDRINTRWGRRRPFLLFGAIPFGLTFALTFIVPPFQSDTHKALYYILIFLLFDTLYTLVNVPYSALTPALTADYDERSNLAGWRMGVSIVAALVTGATFKLLAEDVFAPLYGDNLRLGYAITAGIWGITLALPLLILFANIEEPPHEPLPPQPLNPLQTFREVFSNHPFRLAATVYLLSFAAVDIMLLVFVRYLLDYIGVTPGFDNILIGIMLATALVSMPFTVKMMRTFGKRRTYIVSIIFFIGVLLLFSQIRPGDQTLIIITAILAGIGYAAASAVPWAIVADIIEVDELKSGQRREGLYYGYLVFFRKLAGALSAFVVGEILSATGFISSTAGSLAVVQPQSALTAMRYILSIIPAGLLSLAVIAAWFYPLNRQTYNTIRQQLEERNRQTK